ncbi:MAG: tRNA (adenosine(37)-N6)-threonylcarbamoyltransferase complex dimerization subunit type 1 TsaB [Pseudomonadota bacterium]
MPLLAIDTSAHLCAVCLFDIENDIIIAENTRDIGRGHAEFLIDQIENCLKESSLGYSDLSKVGAVCGPGSFTGLRVGLSVARSFALSLKIEAIGISALHVAEAAAIGADLETKILTVLDARRDEAYCKYSDQKEPFIRSYAQLATELEKDVGAFCGSGSRRLAELANRSLPIRHEYGAPPISIAARLAASLKPDDNPPEPLYLRNADAKPQSGFALRMA